MFRCVAVHHFSPFDLCVCHTSFDTLYISGCSNWCLCCSQWHNRNINVLCMEEFELQGWHHCRYVNSRKVGVTLRLMHFDCLLMHVFPCSVNVKFYSMSMAFKIILLSFIGWWTSPPRECYGLVVLYVAYIPIYLMLLCSLVVTIYLNMCWRRSVTP